ncbi:MAG: helix-turn-helix domain-containing protein [Ilumatobacteraceae bacterium]
MYTAHMGVMGMTDDRTDVLDVVQVAALLDVSIVAVRELAHTGAIPARKVGREWRFSKEALFRWLRQEVQK